MGGQVLARPECGVVEIGSVLRAARERRGLELGEVERETRIRVRYLVALEQERFGLLPARAYAKGFLRVYADFLGLDGRLMVEEFNARFPEVEPPELAVQRASWTHRRRKSRVPVLLVGGLVAAVLAVVVWQLASPEHRPAVPAAPSTGTRPRHAVAAPAPHPRRRAAATLAHLVLRARGPCWLAVRADSGAGPVLYEATLHAGGVLRYTLARARPRLWLRIGAPWNLELSLNGKAATTLPRGPGNVVVTRSGLHPA
jgi:transcriptional regulator with XRE-family HTH domain